MKDQCLSHHRGPLSERMLGLKLRHKQLPFSDGSLAFHKFPSLALVSWCEQMLPELLPCFSLIDDFAIEKQVIC